MKSVRPYKFILNQTPAITSVDVVVGGKSFLILRNLYLSGSDIGMFDNVTQYNPFSAIQSMSGYYPAFDAIMVPEFTVEGDKIITFSFPQNPKTTGLVDIIAENEAGYGKLTQSRLPFLSAFDGAYDIQNPWVDGIIIE